MASSSRMFSLLIILGISCIVGVLSTSPCPISDPNFSTGGVNGVILGSLPNSNTLYQFGSTGPRDAIQCYRACKNWPTYRSVLYTPRNGDTGPCAYWVWKGRTEGCFLLGCNVCKSFSSFDSGEGGSCSTSIVDHFCSGAGPGLGRCSGGVKGDPHYTGGDMSHFEFTGQPGNNYCLVSDSNLHVNVHYGGRFDRWGNNPNKALTWIRKVGILYQGHSVLFSARSGPEWEYGNGYMESILVDGSPITLTVGESETFADGDIEIRWVSAKKVSGHDEIDVYEIFVGSILNMILKVRPEVANLRTNEDGVVHFSLDFPVLELTDNAHGVLGQTYRMDHRDRLWNQTLSYNSLLDKDVVVGENAEGFLDGSVSDYVSSDILSSDCGMTRFGEAATKGSNVDYYQITRMMNSRKLRL